MNNLIKKRIDFSAIAICYYLVMICINSNVRVFIPDSLWFVVNLGFYALVIVSARNIFKSINRNHIVFLLILFLSLFASFLLANDYEIHSLFLNFFIRWGLPLFFLGASISNYEQFFSKLKKTCYALCLLSVLGIFVFKTNGSIIYSYSQDTGYQVLIPFSVFFADFLIHKKRLSLLWSIVAVVIMLIGGARGPLLSFALCFLIELLFLQKITTKKIVIGCSLVICAFLLYYILFNLLINEISNLFEAIGLSTRILDGIKTGTIYADDSRKQLSDYSINYANTHWFVGSGILNDRTLLYNELTVDTNKTLFGQYSHNIFLELLVQYGMLLGLFLSFITIYILFRVMMFKEKEDTKIILFVFLSIGFLPLLVSYSYLTYQYFYLFIGAMLSTVFSLRKKKITRQLRFVEIKKNMEKCYG